MFFFSTRGKSISVFRNHVNRRCIHIMVHKYTETKEKCRIWFTNESQVGDVQGILWYVMSNEHRCIALIICLKVIFWPYIFWVRLLMDNKLPGNRSYIKTITVKNWPCIPPMIISMKNQNTLDTFWIIVNSFLIPQTVEHFFSNLLLRDTSTIRTETGKS